MARPATKFANRSKKQAQELNDLYKTHACHYTRMRAHAILLSGRGYQVKQIVDILSVSRDSVESWIDPVGRGCSMRTRPRSSSNCFASN